MLELLQYLPAIMMLLFFSAGWYIGKNGISGTVTNLQSDVNAIKQDVSLVKNYFNPPVIVTTPVINA